MNVSDESGTAVDAVLASLRQLINDGGLPPGTRLVERELAQRFAVSRVPLREAIQRLAHEGLVDVAKQRGASVRMLAEQDVHEIYDLRILLECAAMTRSVAHMDAAALLALDGVHRQLGQADTASAQGALDRQFHALLYAPCGQARLLRSIAGLRGEIERYELVQGRLLADTAVFQSQHAAILAACKAQDAAKASDMVLHHLEAARQLALAAVRQRAGRS